MTTHSSEHYEIAIVANGSISNTKEIGKRVSAFSFIIAADGGLINCEQMSLFPNLIIGDMDSVPERLLKKYDHIEQKKYPRDKDETDVELAIAAAFEMKPEKVVIFGALERRIDHSLYNLNLLCRYPGLLSIESEFETSFAINQRKVVSCRPGQVVSLLPLSEPAKGITTRGLKWELDNRSFDKNFMSLSNICINDSFTIELTHGCLLCCLVQDQTGREPAFRMD